MINNLELVSAVQQSDIVIYIHVSILNELKGEITAIYFYTIVTYYSRERNATHSSILA